MTVVERLWPLRLRLLTVSVEAEDGSDWQEVSDGGDWQRWLTEAEVSDGGDEGEVSEVMKAD